MSNTARLELNDDVYELPIVVGTENERAIEVGKLRAKSGHITLDEGYGNTGACHSAITFINGEEGILRYRGIPIEQLAEQSTFVETSWLLMYGELPTADELARFRALLTKYQMLHEDMRKHFDAFPASAPPMAVLSAMINTCSCHTEGLDKLDGEEAFLDAAANLLSKTRTIAAAAYKSSIGQPLVYPDPKLDYTNNFLKMMFGLPHGDDDLDPDVIRALEQILILHADHEQNCSTSTVRMVGSSGANLFASCSAGVCALWGPKHGGANVAVLNMLERLRREQIPLESYLDAVRKKEELLWGFGHRVYKNFDPRATILKVAADKVLPKLGVRDPLLEMAQRLEEIALNDSYFKDRNLYPNVDFYSGILMRAMGIPVNMFTVIFAVGRMPGWIAQFKEVLNNPDTRISRPRQIYIGPVQRDYVPIADRK